MSKGNGMPQKQLTTSVKFVNEETKEPSKVLCTLQCAMSGKNPEELTKEERESLMTDTCGHPVWPSFLPQCIACLKDNNHERYLRDKKGREYKVIK